METSTQSSKITKLINEHGSVPPPWFKFPDTHRYSICWRMGEGEDYIETFFTWWEETKESLDESQRIEYFRKWPPPPRWLGWMSELIWDLDFEDFEDEENYRPYFVRTKELGFGDEEEYQKDWEEHEETP